MTFKISIISFKILDNMLGCTLPPIIADPSCPGEDTSKALLPQLPDELREVMNNTMSSYFDILEVSFMEGLIDHQGFLDMILADKFGAGFQQHNNIGKFFFRRRKWRRSWLRRPICFWRRRCSGRLVAPSVRRRIWLFSKLSNHGCSKFKNTTRRLRGHSKKNYNTSTDGGVTTFIYEFPDSEEEGYGFLLADANISGNEYILNLKEFFGDASTTTPTIKEFFGDASTTTPTIDIYDKENLYIRGREDLGSALESYLVSDVGVELSSPEAKEECLINTIVANWSTLVLNDGSLPGAEFNTSLRTFSQELFFYFYKKYLAEASLRITDPTSRTLSIQAIYFLLAIVKKTNLKKYA